MKWRLFAVAATAILPTLVSLGYNEFSVRQTFIADVYTEALRSSRQSQFEIEQIIDEAGAVLSVTATMGVIMLPYDPKCSDALKRLVKGNDSVTSIMSLDLAGRVLCSSENTDLNTIHAHDSYFALALQTKTLAVGELLHDDGTNDFELPIAVPIRDPDGKITGVLAGEMSMRWMGARIHERGVAKGAALTIADRNGYIIARNPFPERFVGTRIPDAFMRLVQADKPGTIAVMSQDGTPRILGYQPPVTGTLGLYVSSGVSEEESLAIVNRITVSGVAAIVAGLGLGLAAAWAIGSRFIYTPVRRILATVSEWRAGAIDVRTHLTAQDGDIGKIGQALDDFIAELALARAASQRAAAHRDLLMHELGHRVKNTLSISVSIANQMFRNAPDERNAFSQRLTALAGAYDLLLADDWTSAQIIAIVDKTLTPHVHSPAQIDAQGPDVKLPSQLVLALSLVLHELATNAVKYGSLSTPDGSILIRWDLQHGTSDILVMTWQEIGGPPVTPPTRQGFGSKLLMRAFQSQFKSRIDIDYAIDGLRCVIEFQIPTQTNEIPDTVS